MLKKSQQPSVSSLIPSSCDQDLFFKRFVNLLMTEGKKTRAHRLILDTLEELVKRGVTVSQSKHVLQEAIQNMQPSFHLRGVRKRGRTQEVPAILPIHRQQAMAVRWLLEGARAKKKRAPNQAFSIHLAKEIIDALKKEAVGVRNCQNLHRKVEANRGSARARWWRR